MSKMIITACIMAIAVFSASASGGSEREVSVPGKRPAGEATPPPIDLAVPADIETATFGLG